MILKYVKEGIFEYEDRDMKFIKMIIQKIPYFSHLQDTDSVLYEIIYAMTPVKMNAGDSLINQNDPVEQIYIIEKGIVEIYLKMGSKEVVLERLFKGSVINYKTVFTETTCQVNMRFATEGVVKMLPLDQDAPNGCIRSICKKHKRLNKIVQKFELKVSKMTPAPLDYILALPKKVSRKLIERTREKLLFGK